VTIDFLAGLAFILVPAFFLLTLLIYLSSKWFFKKEKQKQELSSYMDAMKPAILVLVVSAIVNIFFTSFGLYGNILVITFLGGLYFRYYQIKKWWKPFIISIGIFAIFYTLMAFVTLFGLVLFR